MTLEGLNAACHARRYRLRRERLVLAVAALGTAAAFTFVIFAAYGGFQ